MQVLDFIDVVKWLQKGSFMQLHLTCLCLYVISTSRIQVFKEDMEQVV